MSIKLAALEADRLQRNARWVMVCSHRNGDFGRAYLWHVDGVRLVWRSTEASARCEAAAVLINLYGQVYGKFVRLTDTRSS